MITDKRKKKLFIFDIRGCHRGNPLDDTKNVLFATLSKLDLEDSFDNIALNGENNKFSISQESATKETIEREIEWINANFMVRGATNILLLLNMAIESHICNFSCCLWKTYGPSYLEVLAPKLLLRTSWIVITHFGSSNSAMPLKMELNISYLAGCVALFSYCSLECQN